MSTPELTNGMRRIMTLSFILFVFVMYILFKEAERKNTCVAALFGGTCADASKPCKCPCACP